MHVVTPVQSAHIRLAQWYVDRLDVLQDWETSVEEVTRERLIAFCKHQIDRILSWELPDDKIWRWLWFVQWALVTLWIETVEGERNRTRPLFHEAYRKSGITPPETKEI